MDRFELEAAIEAGRVSAEQLSYIFDDDIGLDEVDRFRAVVLVMKKDPGQAGDYLKRLRPENLARAIDESRLDPALISLAIRLFPDSERLHDAALGFPLTPEPTLMLLASKAEGPRLARLASDELLLLQSPALARALTRNKNLEPEQKERLEQFVKKMEEDEQYQVREEFRPELMKVDDKDLMLAEKEITAEADISEYEAVPESERAEDNKEEVAKERYRNIYVRIQKMTTAEKALLAMRGNRDARLLLVRDPNRMVSQAVLRNPMMNDQDVALITQMRDVDDEIIRMIASNRRWLRRYEIIRNIVFNPRTPLAVALSKINFLNNNDMRMASRERNLPSSVRQAAVRISKQRGLK